jgi:hypothetical protein
MAQQLLHIGKQLARTCVLLTLIARNYAGVYYYRLIG